MVDVQTTVRDLLPAGTATGAVGMITWAVILISLTAVAATIGYIIIMRLRYNKKIVVFEKIAGRYEPSFKDRAMEVKHGNAGDTIFMTKKKRKYLPRPTIQTGRKTYWFVIREDGEWINIGIKDIDEDMREMGAKYLDKEMRYARTGIQKGLEKRYDQGNWLKEHAVMLVGMTFTIFMVVMLWLMFDKFLEFGNTIAGVIQAQDEVLTKLDSLLGRMDNLYSNSGIRPAG